MEAIRVLISQRSVHEIKEKWDEENLDTPSTDYSHSTVWARGAALWPENWLKNQPNPMEVFLALDSELLKVGYNENFIRRVVQHARQSMWGAKVYVVVDNDALLPFESFRLRRTVSGVPTWIEELLGGQVADILQWPRTKKDSLTVAAARSEERMRGLAVDIPNREWKCYVRTPPDLSAAQESFLAPYHIRSTSELGDANCVFVLQGQPDAKELKKVRVLIEKMLNRLPSRRVIIGVIDELEEPPATLKGLCSQFKGCHLIWFHGVVELYFFLRRLSHINQIETTPVPVVAKATFKSHTPQLLITHSYQSGDKLGCLTAARDMWQMIDYLEGGVKVTVYPAVRCVNLPTILNHVGDVLAWVHIGHGDDARGLQQAEDPVFKSADDWLNAFAGYGSSMALAMFSSCYSAPIARRFAEAGVGVSIGFTREIYKKAGVELTKRVVKAALTSNGSRKDILEAFEEGRRVLSIEDKDALPVAFWASH
jgi:hypothetical protein